MSEHDRQPEGIGSGFEAAIRDFKTNLRPLLESALSRLDLVTREEFEVQQAVLARTREKVERLESLVAEMERPDREK
jgi:BMFP domain-containing protein YqiC